MLRVCVGTSAIWSVKCHNIGARKQKQNLQWCCETYLEGIYPRCLYLYYYTIHAMLL